MFHDVRLSDDVEKGASGGPGFKTSVIELKSGIEKRNIDWKFSRARYSISYGIEYKDRFLETLKFFFARQGMAHTFRFRDWADYQITSIIQLVGDGETDTFQLVNRYPSGGIEFVRPVYLPILDSIILTVDDVIITGYDIDNFGTFTLDTTPADGAVVRVSCEFDVMVRFMTDLMSLDVQTFEAASVRNVELIEMRPNA